jgi:hypothetical protein
VKECPLDYPLCERKSCINWKDGHCSLKDPEKNAASCLNFEDAMDFLRLKADALKGALG